LGNVAAEIGFFRLGGAALLIMGTRAEALEPDLWGTVVDSSGHPVEGVEVYADYPGTLRRACTGEDGAWQFVSTTDIGTPDRKTRVARNRKFLEFHGGRLAFGFERRNLTGRVVDGFAETAERSDSHPEVAPVLSRANVILMRSLYFRWKGAVRYRATVVVQQTGSLGTQVIDTTGSPWNPEISYGSMTDERDGRVYRTASIGRQIWMSQNLNHVTERSRGDSSNPANFGQYYTWADAMGLPDSCGLAICWSSTSSRRQGVCPAGWHLPSKSEWDSLNLLVGDTSARKMKAKRGWPPGFASTASAGLDEFGLTVLPAGVKNDNDAFDWDDDGERALFWSSTEESDIHADVAALFATSYLGFDLSRISKAGTRIGVRCLKN